MAAKKKGVVAKAIKAKGRVAEKQSGEAVYRRLALSLPEAAESSHMGAADFRVGGRIFATLAYVSKGLGTLKVSVEQQAEFLAEAPEWFEPAPGGWGRMGMTLVRLDAPESVLAGGLETAFRYVVAAQAAKKRVSRVKSQRS
jgi:hypothetical protein